jgi:hypothetical protein
MGDGAAACGKNTLKRHVRQETYLRENFTLAMTNFKSFVIHLPTEDSKNALSEMWFRSYR